MIRYLVLILAVSCASTSSLKREVDNNIESHRSQLRICYNSELRKQKNTDEWKVEIMFTILSSGRVVRPYVSSTNYISIRTKECMETVLSEMYFSKQKSNKPVNISRKLNLE